MVVPATGPWHKPEDKLPVPNTYVLVVYNGGNWRDNNDPKKVNCIVTKFVPGLSVKEREQLPKNDKRKRTYVSEDEAFNNKRPYCWKEFGPVCLFGQDVDRWAEIKL